MMIFQNLKAQIIRFKSNWKQLVIPMMNIILMRRACAIIATISMAERATPTPVHTQTASSMPKENAKIATLTTTTRLSGR